MSNEGAIYNILAFCFEDKTTASEVVQDLKESQKQAGYKMIAAAVVEVDDVGKVHIHEPGRGGVGATVGAVAGGLLGLIGGPIGVLAWAVAGGAIGGVAGYYFGRVIPIHELKQMGEAMDPDSSAFLVLVEDIDAELLVNELVDLDANLITLTVGDDLSDQIAQAIAADIKVYTADDDTSATEYNL